MKRINFNFLWLLLLSLFWGAEVKAQCVVSAVSLGYNTAYTQEYVLTDLNGVIIAVNSTGTFSIPTTGSYFIHALNYDPANPPAPLPAALIGSNISLVGSTTTGCYNSDFLVDRQLRSCACTSSETICFGTSLIATTIGYTPGYTHLYVLTDATGNILAINSTGDFTPNISVGNSYQVYALNYDPSNPPSPLPVVGAHVSTVGTSNSLCMNNDFFSDYVCYSVIDCNSCATTGNVEQGSDHTNTTGGSNNAFTQIYCLVDPTTMIVLDINATGLFNYNYPIGNIYRVYALNYDPANPPNPMPTIGQPITITGSITQGCFNADFLGDFACNVVTPILSSDALSFGGHSLGETNQLDWRTNGLDNEKFFVERSEDGDKFLVIGERIGLGSTPTEQSYNFLDLNPLEGENYYRIRQVSTSGKTSFSNKILLTKEKRINASLFPNPAEDEISIKIDAEPGTILFVLSNELGQSVLKYEYEHSIGDPELSLLIKDLSAGIYFYKINSPEGVAEGKLVKK